MAYVHGFIIIFAMEICLHGTSAVFTSDPRLSAHAFNGEWWNANVIEIEEQALADRHGPNISDAFTINGWSGDLYNCSSTGTYKLKVVRGEMYLLRIINVALNNELFFKIANHTMTVVAVDACYTNPMVTNVIVIAPGQTIDALLTADQPLASYYMAAHSYDSLGRVYDKTTTRAIITYENATSSTPLMPNLPAFNDTPMAFKFYSNLTSLVNGPHWAPVPLKVDEHMFVTEGLGLVPCGANNTCGAFLGQQFAASMNNESFELPANLSMLEASFYNLTAGIYTTDFPKYPPVVFDYTNTSNFLNTALVMTSRSTKVTKLKFNSTVEIVFQNTALAGKQSHPIHLHGFNFYVLAQGFGNYDPVNGPKMFNVVNPQIRNTVGVSVGGWTVIRFRANNPGVWLMHCHFDTHLSWGLATVFLVEDGPTPSTSLPPPPLDLPHCSYYPKQKTSFIKGGDNVKTVFANVKTLGFKRLAFLWFGSWATFLVPCFIVFVWFSYTMCRVQHSYALKLW
ncbi:hypothetical protein RHSIM_Rhsim05G0203900 [Rhododendron simsii]|uniref:laccase n=1 Tax=Rhododendron simsii TaxID=118357 RepID=A0A834GWR6_RHOSS|nr:hypothetical protein RHSIM_Rhsim05G0203900 [Rhododendron simsii]